VICVLICKAQTDSAFHLFKKIDGKIEKFSVDILDNIYILSVTNQLKKLEPNGDSIAVFNNVRNF
jgi:hypothetical protein